MCSSTFIPIFCFYSQFGCTEVKLKLPSKLWSSGALPRWFKYGSEFSFSNPPPRFSNPKKSSRKRFIFHSFTNFTLNRKQLLTTLCDISIKMPLYPSLFLIMLRCAKTEWSPHYLEASSEYCESFHETSLSALVLDVVNLLYNFIEVTLRRYSTLLPLSAAVKEQNWKQKSPQNDCLVWMNGSGPRVAVIETSDTSQQSGPAPCILSSEDADFQGRTRGGKYCHLDI